MAAGVRFGAWALEQEDWEGEGEVTQLTPDAEVNEGPPRKEKDRRCRCAKLPATLSL